MVKRICCIIGTRPEAIKMAPVVLELRRQSWAEVTLLATGQHRVLLDQALAGFNLQVDEDLGAMRPGQGLSALTGHLFHLLGDYLAKSLPDIIIGQGDTTSAMVAAMCGFYQHIPFAHVEAGLRTGDIDSPFPEELNRRVVALATSLHFPPTTAALKNLLAEGVDKGRIVLTGNPVIDALHHVRARLPAQSDAGQQVRMILLTTHRRENFGAPMHRIFRAVAKLVDTFEDLEVVYPVHPNPAVATLAHDMLGGHPRIHLRQPMDYPGFIATLSRCHLVLTDSGGLQEEAPALGKPVLVLREETERPEAVDCGVAKLVGTEESAIIKEASRLLEDDAAYASMALGASPFGDGQAAIRIVAAVREYLEVEATPYDETQSGADEQMLAFA